MARPNAPRRAADELLRVHGPQERESLIQAMMPLVRPGQAARTAARRHKPGNDDDPRRRDPYLVGQRQVATQILGNATRNGTWVVRDDGRIALRDQHAWKVPSAADVHSLTSFSGYTKWHWAAIIAAHVRVEDAQGRPGKTSNWRFTADEFAGLGISGLGSGNSVRHAYRVWMARFGFRPEPGQAVEVPREPWPGRKDAAPAAGRSVPFREYADSRSSLEELAAEIAEYMPWDVLEAAYRRAHPYLRAVE